MSKKLVFLCNCDADEVEEKFGPDVWTGRPVWQQTGEPMRELENAGYVAVYRRVEDLDNEQIQPV